MGILRTDKISGLETPTPVTGSVVFDGNGDWISVAESEDFNFGTGDFTVEFWIYWDGFNTGGTRGVQLTSAVTNGIWIGQVNTTDYVLRSYGNANHLTVSLPPLNEWHHIAVTRKDSTARFFVNGKLGASGSVTHNFVKHAITIGSDESSGHTNGYISNVRMLKGTALYTSDFTPPTHELEKIGDTVLLCCNNPDSAGAEATGKTITVNGDAAASTVSPGLTRDFTGGTEFNGVTVFDTQGYFVPPSGTTEQRGRGRGVFGGGQSPSGATNTIDYVSISNAGNAIDFGDLTVSRQLGLTGGVSSHSRGVFGGGYGNAPLTTVNVIDYITISTTANALDFGDLISPRFNHSSLSNSTRGLFAGGLTPLVTNLIDYITIASLGNANDFGDLSIASNGGGALSSPTRGVFALGRAPAETNILDYVTIASTGNAQDFGDLTVVTYSAGCCSSSTRGLFAGNNNPTGKNNIDYITITTTGNAQEFGDLFRSGNSFGGTSNSIRGIFAGGYRTAPTIVNTIDYVTIASTGNASDFGDLTQARRTLGACSDSHGGLS